MNNSAGRQYRMMMYGFLALLLSGCAEMPTWVPFQGPPSDNLPGVITPSQKLTQLKKLASKAAESNPATKHREAQQLVTAILKATDPLVGSEPIRPRGR